MMYDLSPSANDLENHAKLSLDFCALFSHKTTSTHLGKCSNSTDSEIFAAVRLYLTVRPAVRSVKYDPLLENVMQLFLLSFYVL